MVTDNRNTRCRWKCLPDGSFFCFHPLMNGRLCVSTEVLCHRFSCTTFSVSFVLQSSVCDGVSSCVWVCVTVWNCFCMTVWDGVRRCVTMCLGLCETVWLGVCVTMCDYDCSECVTFFVCWDCVCLTVWDGQWLCVYVWWGCVWV